MTVRALVVLAALATAFSASACRDDDSPIPEAGVGITPQATHGLPGGTPPPGEPEALLLQHIAADFSAEDWADDIEDVEVRIEEQHATIRLDREGDGDTTAFDEACTAAAGFLMAGEFGIETVSIEDEDGEKVAETPRGTPQCHPL
jgi:hypothetical protein